MKNKGKNMKSIKAAIIGVFLLTCAFIAYSQIEMDALMNCSVAGLTMLGYVMIMLCTGVHFIIKHPQRAFSKAITLGIVPLFMAYISFAMYPGITYPTLDVIWGWLLVYLGYSLIALTDAAIDYNRE